MHRLFALPPSRAPRRARARSSRWLLPLVVVAAAGIGATPASARTVWLCAPGVANNPCTANLNTTILGPSGPTGVEHVRDASKPAIDCFYVYPTVSAEGTLNADLKITPEQTLVAIQQASRFSQVCRVWAPMYRQVTVSGLLSGSATKVAAGEAIAYSDVAAAWRDYLAHDNHGRGVVLIGHSQGSGMLIRLLAQEIDDKPSVRRRLVSAIIPGGNLAVRVGSDVGGSFKHIPTCQSAQQIGCAIAYSTFDQTPPADSIFGRESAAYGAVLGGAPIPGTQVACTNPAALGGGSATLQSYSVDRPVPGPLGVVAAGLGPLPTGVSTLWFQPVGAYTAQCVSENGANVLLATPTPGTGVLTPEPTAEWGLHLADIDLSIGNLVDDVRSEAAAYLAHP